VIALTAAQRPSGRRLHGRAARRQVVQGKTSIDVHTVEGGKLVRSYHVEDWMSAIRQFSAQ
jgi:hypothetical protein